MGDNRTPEDILETDQQQEQVFNDKDSKLWKSAEEIQNPVSAVEIIGKIPTWLNGLYLRIGPGKFDLDDEFAVNSWLDGYAIASKFQIDGINNNVTFQSKFLESAAYKGAMKHGRPIFPEYGTKKYVEAGKSFFSSFVSNLVPEMSDNPTTNYLTYDSSNSTLFVGGESCYFHEYDVETMSVVDKLDYRDVFGFHLCSMHPLIDCNDKNIIYNVGVSILTGVKYNIFKISSDSIFGGNSNSNSNNGANNSKNSYKKDLFKKSFKIISTISSRWTTSMSAIHSFGQTQNYIILIEQPYVVNVKKTLGNALKGKMDCISSAMEWYPEFSNRFYIVSKLNGEILNKSFEILSEKPFFFVHIINSYEDYCKITKKCFIVIDIACFESPKTLNAQNLEQLRSTKNGFQCNCVTGDISYQAIIERFIIPLDLDLKKTPIGLNLLTFDNIQCKSNEPSGINQSIAVATRKMQAGTKSPQIILQSKLLMRKGLELPALNKEFNGKLYSYFYASGLVTLGEFENAIAKVNVNTCEVNLWKESPYFIFGEPVFVPRTTCNTSEQLKQQQNNVESDSNNKNCMITTEEDDGVLIVPMTDSRKGFPDMLFFFNGKDMSEIARAIFDVRIPPSIHGTFIAK